MDFHGFPLEIKYRVFSYLTKDELRDKVSPICEEWRELASAPYFTTKLEIDGNQLTSDQIFQLIVKCPRVRSAIFAHIDDWSWLTKIPNRYSARFLEFVDCKFDSDVVRMLVKKFCFITRKMSFRCFTSDLWSIQKMSKREVSQTYRLNIIFSHRQYEFHEYDTLFKNCPNTESVEIFFACGVTKNVDSSTLPTSNLQTLRLWSPEILNDVNIQALSKLQNLKCLELIRAVELTDTGLLALKKLNHLQDLKITYGVRIKATGFIALFHGTDFYQLRSLILKNCRNFDDDCAMTLIISCPALEILCVNKNNRVTAGVKKNIVLYLRNLQRLEIGCKKNIAAGNVIAIEVPQFCPITGNPRRLPWNNDLRMRSKFDDSDNFKLRYNS